MVWLIEFYVCLQLISFGSLNDLRLNFLYSIKFSSLLGAVKILVLSGKFIKVFVHAELAEWNEKIFIISRLWNPQCLDFPQSQRRNNSNYLCRKI